MCGIVGKIYADRERPAEAETVQRMKDAIVHRGPDDDGTIRRGNAALGFCRLAIIDLSGGHQPMLNEDATKAIVFNGEIYNYLELREQLKAHGHVFATHCDTETILHGYEQWGPAVTERLRGMFAFAIFDFNEQTLFMARDRTGKKPLFYTRVRAGQPDEAFLFASELKALLADPAVERRVDMKAMSHYLSYQYVPHPWSIFEGVKKLPPGHWLLWKRGGIRIERYWHLTYGPKYEISPAKAAEETLERLDEAVRIRLMSEVPLGCFLSGGIDSSLIVAMMRRHVTGDLKTFSIGFREEKWNELPYARQVAQQFDTHHEEFIVEPNALECLGTLAWHFDEPFADSSAIPTYYLARMTRQFVTVALNGDGGDESFAGYSRYNGFPIFNWFLRIPRPLRALGRPLLNFGSEVFPSSARAELLAYVNRVSLMSPERRYVQTMMFFREYQKWNLLAPEHRTVMNELDGDSEFLTEQLMTDGTARDPVDAMMYADIMMYLPGALLPKVDRTTMAVSLEGRSPFLDHKLMEFAARLPADIKYGGVLKRVLKQAASEFFTDEFLNRPKQGFGVPIGEWFRGDLKKLTREFLLGPTTRQRGWFDYRYVQRIYDQHMQGRQNHQHRIWSLIMLEAWARTYLDRPDPASGPASLV